MSQQTDVVVPTPLPSLPDFWDMLERHDWYYSYSDDPRYYWSGRNNGKLLAAIAKEGGEAYQELLDGFSNYYFNKPSPKPERPEG